MTLLNDARFRLITRWMFALPLLCLLLFGGCQSEAKPEAIDAPTVQAVADSKVALGTFAKYFDPVVVAATGDIKLAFEEGLRQYFNTDREVAYLYEQHGRRLRDHYLGQESFASIFPFNGVFPDSQLVQSWEKLPFVTSNCGFQVEEGEVINFLCPAIDETYFTYLRELPLVATPIATFAEEYPAQKNISAGLRQSMLLKSIDELDLTNADHQLFYALFQLWINAEIQARQQVLVTQRAQKAEER